MLFSLSSYLCDLRNRWIISHMREKGIPAADAGRPLSPDASFNNKAALAESNRKHHNELSA